MPHVDAAHERRERFRTAIIFVWYAIFASLFAAIWVSDVFS